MNVGDGASAELWGCSVVRAAMAVHPWGAGGSASLLEGRRQRLSTRGLLAAALAETGQWNYGGGVVRVAVLLGCWHPQMQQPTTDGRGKGGWWLKSRRLMGGNAITSQGRQEQEAAARQEAKTETNTEAQTAMTTRRLLVAMTTSTTQNNNQPTTGASKCE